jgi:hypothetical protein
MCAPIVDTPSARFAKMSGQLMHARVATMTASWCCKTSAQLSKLITHAMTKHFADELHSAIPCYFSHVETAQLLPVAVSAV